MGKHGNCCKPIIRLITAEEEEDERLVSSSSSYYHIIIYSSSVWYVSKFSGIAYTYVCILCSVIRYYVRWRSSTYAHGRVMSSVYYLTYVQGDQLEIHDHGSRRRHPVLRSPSGIDGSDV